MYPYLLTNTKNKDFSFVKMRFLSGIFQTIVFSMKTFFDSSRLKSDGADVLKFWSEEKMIFEIDRLQLENCC